MDIRMLEARARTEGSPIIDGEEATFVWRGRGPVSLAGDFDDWAGPPLGFERVKPGLWARTLRLPRNAYVEYALVDGRGRRVRDPLNPRLTPNGLGGVNHFLYMPEAQPTPLARRQPGVARGTVTRHLVETEGLCVGRRRAVYLYRPPTSEPCPLLVVLDGPDYLRRVRLPVLVDNLVAQGRIRPVALALVASSRAARTPEYACSEATLFFLLQRVLPLARQELRLVDERRSPGAHALLGASLGGLMAVYGALRAPDVFGRVLSQSGAFHVWGWDFVVLALARLPPTRSLDIWMDCGRFEAGLLEGNRRLHPLLAAAGHRVEYREYSGGHNYPAWRDDLWRGLERIFR
jgi:enterochelin esterase family protein